MNQQKNYEQLMRRCIELALVAKQRGDSAVGSVIVQQGKIIAEGIEGGRTHRDITFHAEIEAIRHATKQLERMDLSDCTLVTTHEPCIMCSYVIRHHKIPTVIVGISTGEIGGYSSAFPILTKAAISSWGLAPTVIEGVLENECRELKN